MGQKGGDYAGLSMDDLEQILRNLKLKTELRLGNPRRPEEFPMSAETLTTRLRDSVLIASFCASSFFDLPNKNQGHFSIVAAYNADEGMVLLTDPAAYRTGWHWVSVPELARSMAIPRNISKKPRGLICCAL
jgi:hypothetical protein